MPHFILLHYIPPLIFTRKVSIWEFLGTPWVFQSGLITLPSNTPCTLRWRAVSTAGICNHNINNISSTCTHTQRGTQESKHRHTDCWEQWLQSIHPYKPSMQVLTAVIQCGCEARSLHSPTTNIHSAQWSCLPSSKADCCLAQLGHTSTILYYYYLNFHVFSALWCYFTFLLLVFRTFFKTSMCFILKILMFMMALSTPIHHKHHNSTEFAISAIFKVCFLLQSTHRTKTKPFHPLCFSWAFLKVHSYCTTTKT